MLLLFSFGLMGCPMKEIYKYAGSEIISNEINTLPKTVFYNEHKHGFTGDFVFLLTNLSDKEKILNFQKSYCFNNNDTFYVENVIYEMGHLLSPQTNLSLSGNSQRIIALYFKSQLGHPKSDIQLRFSLSNSLQTVILYKRIRD
jgi:hypothetical protein